MTVGLANAVMPACLSWGDHVTGVFDGASLEQDLPMIFPGVGRKRCRNKKHFGVLLS